MHTVGGKMNLKEDLKKALTELRKEKERKFNQTVDLIINLQKYDLKKNPLNLFISVPYKIKEKKICAFLEVKNKNIETITKDNFKKYSDKKELKKLVKKFDFFIAEASLMPKVATTFGRILGPVGKMPSPQLGILTNTNEKTINELKEKINNSIKIRTKESSIKLAIGKQNMKDEEIIENITSVYSAVLKALSRENDNIKNIEIKFTMTKPQKIKIR
jgi:large subunit ribosomal protein L1|tara:strand:+ start:5294 stop:5944 length:651 start_codon:yes stop_codon:yes gene_type:complete